MLVPTAEEADEPTSEEAREDSPIHSEHHISRSPTPHSEGHDYHISPTRTEPLLSPITSPHSAGSPPVRPEETMPLQELQALCKTLFERVEVLESTTSAQEQKIQMLKAKLKKQQRKSKPLIQHHNKWLKSVHLKVKKKKTL